MLEVLTESSIIRQITELIGLKKIMASQEILSLDL